MVAKFISRDKKGVRLEALKVFFFCFAPTQESLYHLVN
jgi:hypothetical protein